MVTTLNWTTVMRNEVEEARFRLEASAFNVEAKKAKNDLFNCKFKLVSLTGSQESLATAYRPGIVKRIFVEKGNGIPMFTPSEIMHINPKPEKYLSIYTKANLDEWKLKHGEIMLTCSGTIGNVSFVSKTLQGKCFSQNMIRIVAKENAGYIYAFLKSKTGQLILQTNNYGAVIQHIDPEHLDNYQIPNADNTIQKLVHEKILKSFDLRDKSNELLQEAEQLLINSLNLEPLEKLKPDFFSSGYKVQTYSVLLNQIDDRFDGSYHAPIVNTIIDCLLDNAEKILPLGHKELSQAVLHPERFKRIYVSAEDGIPFFGGKGLTSIDPTGKKYISATKHSKRMPGLVLRENMLLVSRSGTIGKVNIVPKHWDGWIASDDLLRIIPASNDIAGYLYVWLFSEYGKILIERFVYGSVVDHIEVDHISKVPIPLLKNSKTIEKINFLALEANMLRSEAYYLEQEAIRQVNEEVIFG